MKSNKLPDKHTTSIFNLIVLIDVACAFQNICVQIIIKADKGTFSGKTSLWIFR